MAFNRWVLKWVLKQLREGAEVMSCGRILYADGPKMEKALALSVFVACFGTVREDLPEEHSVLIGLHGTKRDDIKAGDVGLYR